MTGDVEKGRQNATKANLAIESGKLLGYLQNDESTYSIHSIRHHQFDFKLNSPLYAPVPILLPYIQNHPTANPSPIFGTWG